jgi:hypothetical protein
MLPEARRKGGFTHAVAAAVLATTLIDTHRAGLEQDLDEALALAEEAHRAGTSSGTRTTLTTALMGRACRDLAQQDRAFAEFDRRMARVLEPGQVITWAAGGEDPTAKAIMKNADVRRATVLVLEACDRFPEDPGALAWALVRVMEPARAEQLAEALKRDEIRRLRNTLMFRLMPYHAGFAVDTYWARLAVGDQEGADKVLRDCAARGTPLPARAR